MFFPLKPSNLNATRAEDIPNNGSMTGNVYWPPNHKVKLPVKKKILLFHVCFFFSECYQETTLLEQKWVAGVCLGFNLRNLPFSNSLLLLKPQPRAWIITYINITFVWVEQFPGAPQVFMRKCLMLPVTRCFWTDLPGSCWSLLALAAL